MNHPLSTLVEISGGQLPPSYRARWRYENAGRDYDPAVRHLPSPIPLELNATPLEMAACWPADVPLLMLHSGRMHLRWARWSILATPVATYRFADGRSSWTGNPPEVARGVRFTHDPLVDLDQIISCSQLNRSTISTPALPFLSGWIGYFSYDLGRWIEPRAQHESTAPDDRHWPLIELAYCPDALVYDHVNQSWWGTGSAGRLVSGLSEQTDRHDLSQRQPKEFNLGALRPDIDPDRYVSMVARTIEYIGAGDIFQANIAQRFTASFQGSTRSLALAALRQSQAWYGAYLELPPTRIDGLDANSVDSAQHSAIISLSPELFLEIDPRTRDIVTRPIKGTRPAMMDPKHLLDSEKDSAELHMIVDLMRNDLGRICEFGSVRVPSSRSLETHPTVHHAVGEITGRLRGGVTVADILRATFPGGSVTGAPKIRAMQIIDELEPVRRGPYCGAIGFIGDCGTMRLSIAIRTLLMQGSCTSPNRDDVWERGTIDYFAGAGIVADSSPLAEFAETLDKTAVVRLLAPSGTKSAEPLGTPRRGSPLTMDTVSICTNSVPCAATTAGKK